MSVHKVSAAYNDEVLVLRKFFSFIFSEPKEDEFFSEVQGRKFLVLQ